ncbi:MAG: hypothetical protein GXX85_07585 [Ignavibacteria bacterium]|nr:hypothetical protein [Ignavibacteria bacterium]
MSVKTKEKMKGILKLMTFSLFAISMFLNIEIALQNESEISSGELSFSGIEVSLFESTHAEDKGLPCYYSYFWGSCTIGGSLYCVGSTFTGSYFCF